MLIAAAAKRRKQKETRQEQAVRAQTIVHNDELAIRADDLLPLPGTERVRTSGSSAWQSMLPSAFLRCAFDGPTGTKKSTAERFKCGDTHAKHVQWMASDLCLTGQSSGISALQARHDVDYVIFSFMMDETSFRIRTVGDSPEVLPTLAMHGHLTWSERGETRNEDVVMMPAAMGNQTAGSLWPALVARAAPVDLLRPFPEAQLRALCPGSDHARAMQKVWNYLESRLPEDTFFCRGLCKQHATGLCVAPVTTFFDLLCPAFCSVKLLHQGHFQTNYMQGLYLTIHRSVTCILAVDAPAWRPKPADRDHAERLLECCFYSRDLHAIHASDEEMETHKARDKQRREAGARLISLCPGDWRKQGIIHWCKEGCCASFTESVVKIFDACTAVLSQVIPVPAQNKWTQVFPVMAEIAVGVGFHQVMPRAMEFAHTRVQPGTADSDSEDADPDDAVVGFLADQRRHQTREKQKRSSKSLAWFRSPTMWPSLLVWLAIVASPMRLHYFLFRDSTSFLKQSEPSQDMLRPPIFDFVDTAGSRPRQSLRDLEALLVPTHSGHHEAWRLVYNTFGTSWPPGCRSELVMGRFSCTGTYGAASYGTSMRSLGGSRVCAMSRSPWLSGAKQHRKSLTARLAA